MAESRPKRILPPVYLLAALLAMFAVHRWLPLARLVDSPYRYAGVLPIACGLSLAVWCSRLFKRADTTIRPFEESSALVTSGPFAYSRNPIYVGLAVVLLGVAVLLGTLTPFLVIPVFVALIHSRFVLPEEAALAQLFGSQYAAYRDKVRRWL
jgi:protein-S-isoprenylcysteine O-methyltransferase Ste14